MIGDAPPTALMLLLRLRQGARSLLADWRPVDLDLAARYLTPELLALFKTMSRGEQLHSLNVLRTVQQHSQRADLAVPHDLAVAALLHDVGKSRCRLNTAEKTLGVMVRMLLPAQARRWGESQHLNHRWRRIFMVYWQHPGWSAALVQGKVSERALWLIEHHADSAQRWMDHPDCDLLIRLQAADDWN